MELLRLEAEDGRVDLDASAHAASLRLGATSGTRSAAALRITLHARDRVPGPIDVDAEDAGELDRPVVPVRARET
jgi:hypothetical protein